MALEVLTIILMLAASLGVVGVSGLVLYMIWFGGR